MSVDIVFYSDLGLRIEVSALQGEQGSIDIRTHYEGYNCRLFVSREQAKELVDKITAALTKQEKGRENV